MASLKKKVRHKMLGVLVIHNISIELLLNMCKELLQFSNINQNEKEFKMRKSLNSTPHKTRYMTVI